MERALRNEKARQLKTELDEALDAWQKQVLAVQSASIQRAEERARQELLKRKLRIASELRERRERHAELLQRVQADLDKQESDSRKVITEKQVKTNKWLEQRQEALAKSRFMAQKSAELRHVVK